MNKGYKMNKWFEIFKIGTHSDSAGISHTYTEADLDTIAANYNPQHSEAPLVIGHPKTNEPAYGWVGEVKRFGNSLFAKAKSIVPEFEQAIKEGLFAKRSIALNPDNTLRHVGFLGAVPPAVKGMQDLAFADEDKSETFEISEFADIEKEDEVIIPDSEAVPVEDEEEILPESVGDIPPQKTFSQTSAASTVVNTPSEDDSLRLQLQKLYVKQRITDFEIFLNEKLIYGTITVPVKKALVKLVEVVSSVNFNESNLSNTFCFADGTTTDPLETIKNLVNELPDLKLTKNFAEKGPEVSEDNSFAEFNVDGEAFIMHNKILAVAKEKNISYPDATKIVFNS